MASDLRLIVSVVRITAELERIGDLALRVAKLAPDHTLLHRFRRTSSTCSRHWPTSLSSTTASRCGRSPAQSAALAEEVSAGSPEVSLLADRLVAEVHRLQGDDAVPVAVKAMAAGQALSRIDDHATILGARLRYLFTGDPDHLAAEVR